jgi:non-homologous end joining protein Ku
MPTPVKRSPTRTSSRATRSKTDTFVEVNKDKLENVALESTRTIEIDEFVDRTDRPQI